MGKKTKHTLYRVCFNEENVDFEDKDKALDYFYSLKKSLRVEKLTWTNPNEVLSVRIKE